VANCFYKNSHLRFWHIHSFIHSILHALNIQGKYYRTIWLHPNNDRVVQIIDQRHLPHRFVIEDLSTLEDFEAAIRDMHVRGAPLIGSAAAYGMWLRYSFPLRKILREKCRKPVSGSKQHDPLLSTWLMPLNGF
jgi:hypothetical protein